MTLRKKWRANSEYLHISTSEASQPSEKVGWVGWRPLAGLFANDQAPPLG